MASVHPSSYDRKGSAMRKRESRVELGSKLDPEAM